MIRRRRRRRRASHRGPQRRGYSVIGILWATPVVATAMVVVMTSGTPGPEGEHTVDPAVVVIQPSAGNVPVEYVDPAMVGPAASGQVGAIQVDPAWLTSESARSGIPARALQAYAAAEIALSQDTPECRISWNTLAALGWIESGHGSHANAILEADGTTSPPIVGPALNGTSDLQAIRATAATTAATGDPDWDHAVGPMQFIGSTWEKWGADASGDGVADPNSIDDSALTAARYLCAGGRDMSTGEGWTKAVHSYNHSNAYVDAVRTAANGFVTG